MANPTFNGFSLQDSNFITERVVFKGYGKRSLIRGKINRREGVKLVATEFGEKEITLKGVVIGSSPSNLQSLLDNMKKSLTEEEGQLIIETGRTFNATVENLAIADEHYNQTRAPFEVTFICSDPFSVGQQLTVVTPVTSGIFTFSGYVNISGTFFARPTITYTPPNQTGSTYIRKLTFSHVPTGQTTTISGLGSGALQGLSYQNVVTVNLDNFTSLEGTTEIGNIGSFPKYEPGDNNYTITTSGRAFPGGTVTLTYQPRYL